jgi:hypothetical protein
MKPVLSDKESLTSVAPTTVEDYLRRTGWTEVKRQPNFAARWERHDDGTGRQLRVIVPLDQELGDYAARMADVLRVLESLEQRPASDIFAALSAALHVSDAFEVAIERDDIVHGLIPITVGSKAFQGTKDIFWSAAAAEHEAHAVLPKKLPMAASEALRHTFFSQTREGSYVINVVSKMPPQQELLAFAAKDANHEPMQRRVFRRVAVALDAVRQAATEDTEDAFASRIGLGVSWNLCRAVAKLGGSRHFRQVTFTPRWTPQLPRPAEIPERIVFYSKMMGAVREGAARLKEIRPVENFSLKGIVVELRRRGDVANEGTVVVEGFVDATSIRRVSMELRGAAHDIAVEAYRTGEEVVCVGALYVGVATHRLIAVKEFYFAKRR